MLKKILLLPYFGEFPPWMDKWVANMEYLKEHGYDYKIYTNLELFEERVQEVLGVYPNIRWGSGKAWDFRPALGALFSKDVKGYDYWGHTDFDCVYGDISKFLPDSTLAKFDIWSNHDSYVAGPWSLYRNCKLVNNAFRLYPEWRDKMEHKDSLGWIEKEYSKTVEEHLDVSYNLFQTKDWDNFDTLRFVDGKLYEGGEEVMMAHFRRTKRYPC